MTMNLWRSAFRLDEHVIMRLGHLFHRSALLAALYLLPTLSVFIIVYDQGHILESWFGIEAAGVNRLHEFFHDVRHVAGFMCH